MSFRIAVLGAGIMGCFTALLLARRGHQVVLFDSAKVPFSGASRWNEGKIHLGYLYSADPSLATARKVIPGGLMFRPLVERLLDCTLAPVTTMDHDLFLCHRESVVSAQSMLTYFRQVTELVSAHANARNYLSDIVEHDVQHLSKKELSIVSGSPDIVAGFRVPERSVSTNWIADRFVDAVKACPRIELRMDTEVNAVTPANAGVHDGPWNVATASGVDGSFDWVLNALWHGRLAIDLSVGIEPVQAWSNRFRLAVFLRTARSVDVPSATIAAGPFGDLKNYGGREFYASWYPLGLMIDSTAVSPPPPSRLDEDGENRLARAVLERLGAYLPASHQIGENVESFRIEGGWVHAAGVGVLSDPASTLHRRSSFGVIRSGTYLSVDTGKYSTAPWLAHRIADIIQ